LAFLYIITPYLRLATILILAIISYIPPRRPVQLELPHSPNNYTLRSLKPPCFFASQRVSIHSTDSTTAADFAHCAPNIRQIYLVWISHKMGYYTGETPRALHLDWDSYFWDTAFGHFCISLGQLFICSGALDIVTISCTIMFPFISFGLNKNGISGVQKLGWENLFAHIDFLLFTFYTFKAWWSLLDRPSRVWRPSACCIGYCKKEGPVGCFLTAFFCFAFLN